jgi:hypothetical protein
MTARNLPTNCASAAAITARDAEYPGTPFTDVPGDGTYADPYLGMNRAGSNAPGIGICTGITYQTAAEIAANGPIYTGWTEDDQAGNPRIPQDSQTISGIVAAAPEYEGVPYPTPAQGSAVPVTVTTGADINNTANFVITDTAAADGAVMDTVSGAINNTGATVGIGDLVWGQVPVA